jgi:transposase
MERNTIHALVHHHRDLGRKQREIAFFLNISQVKVSRILSQSVETPPQWGGHKRHKVDASHHAALCDILDKGAVAYGFEGEYWTSKRVQKVVSERFSINCHVSTILKLLHTLGYSPQKPKVKDYRQNPEKVKEYREKILPELKKSDG